MEDKFYKKTLESDLDSVILSGVKESEFESYSDYLKFIVEELFILIDSHKSDI